MNSMSDQTARWYRLGVWWKEGVSFGRMRWREEQPTCHLSLGWWRGADYDVCYHPSARFWRGICHHGWAEGKSDEASVALQTPSCLRGIGGRGGGSTCHMLWKISPSSSRWSLPDLLVPVSWCARAVTLEGKGTPKLFLVRSPVWVSSLAFSLGLWLFEMSNHCWPQPSPAKPRKIISSYLLL